MLEGDVKYEYNPRLDVLYLTIADSEGSFGHEDDYGVVLNYDKKTKQLVGIDIWDFMEKFREKQQISLPISIDLNSIYHKLLN